MPDAPDSAPTAASMASPPATRPSPLTISTRGPVRSDSRPANGAIVAITAVKAQA